MGKYNLKRETDYLNSCFHRVCEGETLFDVALKYGTTAHLLAKENGLTGELHAGDMLIVTRKEGRRYIVKEGDTLSSISVINKIPENEILLKNQIDFIYSGLTLLL